VRLSLPTRIPLQKVFAFALLLFVVQLFQHTDPIFALMFFGFLTLSAVAFNIAEGFSRLTGAYIFWYSMLIVTCGVFWKSVVNEPADSNLQTPLLDMALYTGSMVMLLAVTLLNRRMDLRSMGVGSGFGGEKVDLSVAGLGCVITSIVIDTLGSIFGQAPGGLISALIQVNFFFQLGIILATAGAIRDSGGKRSLNFANASGIILFSIVGVSSFGKQGMLTPYLCWVIGAFYMRLKVRLIHVLVFAMMVFLTFEFIGPLSTARDLVPDGASIPTRLGVVAYQLAHWSQFKAHVKQLEEGGGHDNGAISYYNNPQGAFIERLSMIPPDDTFIAHTSRGNFAGTDPLIEWAKAVVPRFLNKNKENFYTGNHFAHEIGGYLSADDTSTGISFSPVSTAYHCVGWGGIFWLLPLVWILLFTTTDFIAGDLSKHPWGLMVVVWFAHQAPESLISGMIYFMSYGNFGLFIAIIICTRIAPIIGSLFTGKVVPVRTQSIGRRRIAPPLHGPQLQE
jgi:hypothetical protein